MTVHFLLLTESAGAQGFPTLAHLAEKMLFLAAPDAAIRRVRYEPASDDARRAMAFNAYKSTKKRDHHFQLDLASAIATRLLRADRALFVLVHVDGDRRWSERGEDVRARCDNQIAFERNVLRRVQAHLEHRGRLDLLDRVLYAIPFWSTETWLYQNTAELAKICDEHPLQRPADSARVREWCDDPASLDEFAYPKNAIPAIQDRYNVRLAQTFPARKVHALGLSFAASADGLRECPALLTALATLRHDEP